MGTPELHLDAIRQRLIDLQAPAPDRDGTADLPWGQPQAHPTPNHPVGPSELAATVEALRQRSATVSPEPSADSAAPQPAPTQPPPDLDMHLHRLRGQARHINGLAQEQAAALQVFKRSVDSLAWHLRRHDSPWALEQFCRLEPIAIAQVLADNQGAIILTSTPIDLYEDEHNAAQTAHLLRNRPHRPGTDVATWSTLLIREQIAALTRLWGGLTATLERHSHLSALDILGWLLGGVISRKVLELALATLPSLWPLLIGSIVALVGWALYRLITNPRSDLAMIARILLALLGLVLGGQL